MMKNIAKTLGLFILAVGLSCAASKELSKEIHTYTTLTRTIGSSEAKFDFKYGGDRQAAFSLDEIWVNDKKVAAPGKRGEPYEGCFTNAPARINHEERVTLDENEKDITIKTKWTGESKGELVLKHTLPNAFKVVSVSKDVSPMEPLRIELESEEDWDSCSVLFTENPKNSKENNWSWHSWVSGKSQQTFEIELKTILEGETQGMPTTLYFQLACNKHFSSESKKTVGALNSFDYKLVAPDFYPLNVLAK